MAKVELEGVFREVRRNVPQNTQSG